MRYDAARWLRLGLAGTLAASYGALGLGATARADAAFDSVAGATGLRITLSNDKGTIPTFEKIDFGLGSAQATLNSLGSGQATASDPDPGVAGTLPAIGAGLIPGLLPVPLPAPVPALEYPGTVSVQAGQAPAERGSGPYRISAAMTANGQNNTATARSVIGGRTSTAPDDPTGALAQDVSADIVSAADGRVVATSNAIVDGLIVNGLLTIGRVNATAIADRAPTGKLTRTASLYIGEMSVAGVRAAYQNGQFVAATTGTPFPQGSIESLVNTASHGMFQLKIQPALDTPNGVVAPTLQLIQTVPAPQNCVSVPLPGVPVLSGVTYCGTTTAVYEFGRADASTNYTVTDSQTGTPVAPGAAGQAPGAAALGPAGSVVPAGIAVGSPTTLPTTALRSAEVSKVASTVDLRTAYLVLGALALTAVAAAGFLGLRGVRNRWAS